MKQIKLIDRSRATYEIPATRIICVQIKSQLLYVSGDYGKAGGNPLEDEETVLG